MPLLPPSDARRRFVPQSSASCFVAAAAFALIAGAPLAAQIVPIGGDIAVSQPDGDYEGYPRVAADRSGGWGVAWRSVGVDFVTEIGRQRRFDRDDHAVPGTLRDQEFAFGDLGLDGAGNGVLVGVRARPELSGAEVDAQCLDRAGAPRGARVRVDSGTISNLSRVPSEVRVATASGGESVVVWQENPRDSAIPPSVFYRRLAADCTPIGQVGSLGAVGVAGRRQPDVAVRPDGGFVLAFVAGESTGDLDAAAQQFAADGSPLAPAFTVSQSAVNASRPAVAVAGDGRFAIVWTTYAPLLAASTEGSPTGIAGRVFAADGTALGGELSLRLPRETTAGTAGVAAVRDRFVAAWGENGFVEEGSAVYGRVFEASGPAGGEYVLNVEHTDPDNVGIASLGGNEFVVVWEDLAEGTLPEDIVARRFLLAPSASGCAETGSALCLGGSDRFRIEVEWRDYQGHRGSGHSYPLTSDSGLFWFFGPTNLEVLVKVVDACSAFSRHWVYAAATTDVEYTLTATDTTTGRSRTYFNPLGRRSAAITDSDAFATCP